MAAKKVNIGKRRGSINRDRKVRTRVYRGLSCELFVVGYVACWFLLDAVFVGAC